MKKIILSMIGISFLFLSCNRELIEFQEDDSFSFSTSSSQVSATCEPDLEALEASLPDFVSLRTTENPGDNSYFIFDILDTDLAATDLEGWCGDVDGYLEVEGPYDFNVYSSYEDFPAEEFENPQNFPLVNWIMNQDFIGQVSPISGETYTYGMVQWAIWELLDDRNCINCYYLTGDVKDGWKQNSAALEAVAMEIVDAAIANGQDFVPGCNQQVALIFIAKERNAQNQIIQSIIQMVDVPEKEEECFECEGKVTDLTLQYNGTEKANIRVETKKKGEDGSKIVFDGMVEAGAEFSFTGNDKKGTLGTEIKIYVNNDENTKIHTSCSKPIGPGLISGDFEVISGTSREGGNLCPVDTPPGGDCGECEGKITDLELQYNGDAGASIKVKTKKDGENGSKVVFEGFLMPNETFSFDGNDKKGTLGTEITIYVDGNVNTKIHTSCSKPIGPGLVSGDFTVLSGTSREGGELCPVDTPPGGNKCGECEGKVTELELQYDGNQGANIVVKTKKEGEDGNKKVFEGYVLPGETFSFQGNDKKGTLGTEITIYADGSVNQKIHTSCSKPIGPGAIFGDYTVISGASREGGELCETDYENDDGGDDDDDDNCECDGKLTELDLLYDGDSNLITVKTKGKKGTVIFESNVDNGGIIELIGNDKHGTLGTEITIYVNGKEATKIHTSCSDPNVVPGYVIGNFEVVRGASRNNGELCQTNGGY